MNGWNESYNFSDNYDLRYYSPSESQEAKYQTLLFIHGMDSSKETWKDVIDPLKDQYTIYAIDLRGYGESPLGPIESTSEYTLNLLAEDIHNFVKKHHLENIILVGHSLGAIVSLAYASQHPDFVKGVVLEDMDLETRKAMEFNQVIEEASSLSPIHQNRNKAEKEIDRLHVDSNLKEKWKKEEIKEAFDKNIVITARPWTNYLASHAWSEVDSNGLFQNLKNIPVLLLEATRKTGSPKERSRVSDSDSMKKLNPNLEVIPIPDSSHNIHKSQKEAYIKKLSEFLSKTGDHI